MTRTTPRYVVVKRARTARSEAPTLGRRLQARLPPVQKVGLNDIRALLVPDAQHIVAVVSKPGEGRMARADAHGAVDPSAAKTEIRGSNVAPALSKCVRHEHSKLIAPASAAKRREPALLGANRIHLGRWLSGDDHPWLRDDS